jgi:hypothetical protein
MFGELSKKVGRKEYKIEYPKNMQHFFLQFLKLYQHFHLFQLNMLHQKVNTK